MFSGRKKQEEPEGNRPAADKRRNELAADIEAFLAKGGQIHEVPSFQPDESSLSGKNTLWCEQRQKRAVEASKRFRQQRGEIA